LVLQAAVLSQNSARVQIGGHGFFATTPGLSPRQFMTILNVYNNNPLIDGRQSERAMLVRKGVQLLLHEMRHAVLPESSLASTPEAFTLNQANGLMREFKRRLELAKRTLDMAECTYD
jgi:hypothetical protein